MRRYCRILSLAEKIQIVRDAVIKTNRDDWVIYQPGSGVFLFDLFCTKDGFIEKVALAHQEDHPETWLLLFDADIKVDTDKSQCGWHGAVIHYGEMSLSDLRNIQWIKMSGEPLPDLKRLGNEELLAGIITANTKPTRKESNAR